MGDLPHDARSRRKLVIQTHTAQLDVSDAVQLDVEFGIPRLPDGGQRLTLVFIIGEEVQLVLYDRAAQGHAGLLIRVRKDAMQHRVFRVELAVAKVTEERSRKRVR